jgi:hypothetical protein
MSYRVLRSIVIFGIGCATVFACYIGWDLVRQARALFRQPSNASEVANLGEPNLPDPFATFSSNSASGNASEGLSGAIETRCDEPGASCAADNAAPCNYTELAQLPEAGPNQAVMEESSVPPELTEAPPFLPELPVDGLSSTSGPPNNLNETVPNEPGLGESNALDLSPNPELPAEASHAAHVVSTAAPSGTAKKCISPVRTSPIECEIVDRDSGTIVASFRISEASDVLPSQPVHGPEIAAENPASHGKQGGPYAPFLDLRIDLHTGRTLIDARNLPLDALVMAMSQRYHFPIECKIDMDDSVSARIEARDPVTALRRIVEPSGYAVLALPDRTWQVVRAVATQAAEPSLPKNAIALTSAQTPVELNRQSSALPIPRPTVHRQRNIQHAVQEACSPEAAEVIRSCQQLVASGRSDLALDGLSEILVNSPNCAPAARLLAECYIARDDMESALMAATEALRLNRRSADANLIMGRVLQELGQDERSEHYLNQAEYLRAEEAAQ